MKKYNIYKTAVCAFVLGLSLSSCGDFLDQPDNSNYNADTFYNGDTECYQGANSLYSMPWYDFQRGFFKVAEVMSGNYYWYGDDNTQYWNCSVSAFTT
jgi:starch-binding outer membrane protein, SusD/RagB family